jgi:hypothetical protein
MGNTAAKGVAFMEKTNAKPSQSPVVKDCFRFGVGFDMMEKNASEQEASIKTSG